MAFGALLGLWLALWAAGDTPVGHAMRGWMVEWPARRLSRISRGQILLFLTLASVVVTLIWLLENDGRMLVAMGLPDVLGFAMAFDVASLLDLAAVAVLAASTIRLRAVGRWVATRLSPRRPRKRSVRVRRTRLPANDDEGRPALAA